MVTSHSEERLILCVLDLIIGCGQRGGHFEHQGVVRDQIGCFERNRFVFVVAIGTIRSGHDNGTHGIVFVFTCGRIDDVRRSFFGFSLLINFLRANIGDQSPLDSQDRRHLRGPHPSD